MVIPEDYVLDQYIVKPLTRQLLHDLNKQNAKVEVCTNPRFRGNKGKTGVLNAENILTVVRLYPMYDLYIALVDRDGDPNRQAELNGLEQAVRAQLAPGQQRELLRAGQSVRRLLPGLRTGRACARGS